LTFVINNNSFLDMIHLNSQQRNVLLVIIAVIFGILTFKIIERQRQAMAFDIKALLDGYKYSSPAVAEKNDTLISSNIINVDTSN